MNKIYAFLMIMIFNTCSAIGATVIATVNGAPITDTDITARTELMARQGNTSATNRRQAFKNIVDDYVKLNYAANFNVKPTDKDADKELERMNLTDITPTMKSMARLAMRANIAWQTIIGRTIIPTIDVDNDEIQTEKNTLIRERGLPIEITMLRLIDIPNDVAEKLTKPKNCDDAVKMAENLGGVPQKITAMQYELSPDIRNRIANLPKLKWSPVVDNSVLLVCSEKKTKEYQNLDEIIKQNAMFQKASINAEQQLKQLRRKAVIIINDERYKL